jgi:hypothetical protein
MGTYANHLGYFSEIGMSRAQQLMQNEQKYSNTFLSLAPEIDCLRPIFTRIPERIEHLSEIDKNTRLQEVSGGKYYA